MGDIWVFGYGSLVYKPGFEHAEAVEGFIKGYRRVFWQGSTDHRGTPAAPGRTVTLQPEPDAVTWGVAYRLAGSPQQQQQTLQYLEWREKQYDKRVYVDIHDSTGTAVVRGALAYLATDGPQNVNWLGPAPLQDIAKQVAAAVGPSGPNYEYVFRLAAAMRQMGVNDAELFQLEAAVRSLLPPAVLLDGGSSDQSSSSRVTPPLVSAGALESGSSSSSLEGGLEKQPKGGTGAVQLTAVAVMEG